MNIPAEPNISVGDIMKVMAVDPPKQTIHVIFLNGKLAKVTMNCDELPKRGDVILVGDDFWNLLPQEMWLVTNSVAVVRKVLDDELVLVDDGLGLKQIKNVGRLELAVNNTIEHNEFDGVVSVISAKPIRARDFELDRDKVLKEYRIDTSGSGPDFSDFGGYEHVIHRARELIETQFTNKKHLDAIGAQPIKGVLFSGPPGTGKTHLARIIAHSSKAEFYLVSGPSIVSKWVGDTEDTLRKIFEAATTSESGRAIIFFDEIDSIAERRSGEVHEASKRLVGQLLTLMDGFEKNGNSVIVIAATNRVETLDPALLRPGRFDWEIEFGSPTLEDRLDILKVGARKLCTRGKLPFDEVAEITEGWSAAQLSSIWSEAALVAASDARNAISSEDMVQAFERVARRPKRSVKSGGGE